MNDPDPQNEQLVLWKPELIKQPSHKKLFESLLGPEDWHWTNLRTVFYSMQEILHFILPLPLLSLISEYAINGIPRGTKVDVRCAVTHHWYSGTVIDARPVHGVFCCCFDTFLIQVHFDGWPNRWDKWITVPDAEQIQPWGTKLHAGNWHGECTCELCEREKLLRLEIRKFANLKSLQI